MTQLYYILANDANGDDLSGFVEASSLEEAIPLWEAWRKSFTDNEPVEGFRVFLLPKLTGKSRALLWNGLNDDVIELDV